MDWQVFAEFGVSGIYKYTETEGSTFSFFVFFYTCPQQLTLTPGYIHSSFTAYSHSQTRRNLYVKFEDISPQCGPYLTNIRTNALLLKKTMLLF